MPARLKITVAGGGFAGLETAFLLHHRLRGAVDITLVSDQDDFLFRPNTIYIPFGAEPSDLEISLAAPTTRQGIELKRARVREVDPEQRRLITDDGALPYDRLVLATGADMRPQDVPGLAEHATTIWTPAQMLELRESVERIVESGKAGRTTTVLFVIPPNNKCSGPLYEILFMLDTHLRRKGARSPIKLIWATKEQSYIQPFGPRIHDVVDAEFKERGIEGYLEHVAEQVSDKRVTFENGVTIDYDELIAFPPYVAAVRYPALPSDERGFLLTESKTRQVRGFPDIYAPGDAGDFPVKQAFLAFLQADAVADEIAANLHGEEQGRSPFDPVSMCVMEQFDKATFAQVPLRVTGDPDDPVEVRPGAEDMYKVGVSRAWRLGKKLLGIYLPMRFRAGEPFHAGAAWTMMDVGLRAMSRVLAD